MENVPYASAVGSLTYAQVCMRPDLAFATGVFSRYLDKAGWDHWVGVKKSLRYCQATKDFMLTYKRTDDLQVVCYTDADLGGDADDRKSTFGFVFMLAGGAIAWKSKKQGVTAASTMQAEFVACYDATGPGAWLKNFIPELRIVDSISRPIPMYCDNQATIFFAANDKITGASMHIDLKYRVVKERDQDRTFNVTHISTKLNIADPLTKGLPPSVFQRHVTNMGLVDTFEKVLTHQGH